MDFIDKMIDIRIDSDTTQKNLATIFNMKQQQLARYESRRNIPSILYLIKFCRHYKVSADYILGLPDGYAKSREELANRKW